jgi:hypothetical protein
MTTEKIKTGNIKIRFEEGKAPSVEIELTDNNLWLTQNEIARFFGVFVSKINAELNSIFKAGLLIERECTICNRYTDNGLEKQTTLYNLDALIFLSYRLDSFEARIFREFLKSALHNRLYRQKMPEMKIIWAYMPMPDNYCLN